MLTDLAPSPTQVALTIQLAVAPIFLLAGVGAFLNVCAGRLSRIVDRARDLEPRILKTRGNEHARLIAQIRVLDRRVVLVSWAIFLAVLSAIPSRSPTNASEAPRVRVRKRGSRG